MTRRDILKGTLGAALVANMEEANGATTPSTALLLDPVYKQHDTGAGHPEQPARYDAVTQALSQTGLIKTLGKIEQRPATEDEVALCHGRAYIEIVKHDITGGARELSTGDTTIGPKSLDIALRAVGGLLNAVDAVTTGKAGNAFCAVRP